MASAFASFRAVVLLWVPSEAETTAGDTVRRPPGPDVWVVLRPPREASAPSASASASATATATVPSSLPMPLQWTADYTSREEFARTLFVGECLPHTPSTGGECLPHTLVTEDGRAQMEAGVGGGCGGGTPPPLLCAALMSLEKHAPFAFLPLLTPAECACVPRSRRLSMWECVRDRRDATRGLPIDPAVCALLETLLPRLHLPPARLQAALTDWAPCRFEVALRDDHPRNRIVRVVGSWEATATWAGGAPPPRPRIFVHTRSQPCLAPEDAAVLLENHATRSFRMPLALLPGALAAVRSARVLLFVV